MTPAAPHPRPRPAAEGVVASLGAVVFVLFGIAVGARWRLVVHDVDLPVEDAVHQFALAHPLLVEVAAVVSAVGSPTAMNLLALLAVVGLGAARRPRAAVAVAAARLVELAVETATKVLVDRHRPHWNDPLAVAHGLSFPSGHSAGSAVVATALVLLPATAGPRFAAARGRGVSLLCVVFVVFVAASRIVLGVHYLSDVIAGVALGVATAIIVTALVAVLPDPRLSDAGERHEPD